MAKRSVYRALESFLRIIEVWYLKERLESIKMPRNFTAGISSVEFTKDICLIRLGSSKRSLLLLQKMLTPSPLEEVEKNSILVLSGWSISLLERKKSQIFLNSILTKVHNDSTLLAEARSVVSSAKSKERKEDDSGRSFM